MQLDPVFFDIYNAFLNSPDTIIIRNGGDGCCLNSHVACAIIARHKLLPVEIFLGHKKYNERRFFSPTTALNEENIFTQQWLHHVVPACKNGKNLVIFDPFLFESPALWREYRAIFPRDIPAQYRDSSKETLAMMCYNKPMTTQEMIRSFNVQYCSIRDIWGDDLIDFDKIRAGPTLGEFVKANLIGKRHKSRAFARASFQKTGGVNLVP